MPQDPVNNPPHNPQHGILQNGAAQTPCSARKPGSPAAQPARLRPAGPATPAVPAGPRATSRSASSGAAAGWGRRRDSGPHQAL